MYLSQAERSMLLTTIYNLMSALGSVGQSAERLAELSAMTDTELEKLLSSFLAAL